MLAVDNVLESLKQMSKQVTTPEEIAQVCKTENVIIKSNIIKFSISDCCMVLTSCGYLENHHLIVMAVWC